MIARLTERMITMIVDVKTCGECKWWSDRPNVGYHWRSLARYKLTGCLTDSLFFRENGKEVLTDGFETFAQSEFVRNSAGFPLSSVKA